MEIPQGNTLENSGKQNPKMGFKSLPSTAGNVSQFLTISLPFLKIDFGRKICHSSGNEQEGFKALSRQWGVIGGRL